MLRWLMRGNRTYEVQVSPEGDGFSGVIWEVRREKGRALRRAEWHRLDLPRPTRRLAERDAQALAVALLDQAEVDAAAARGAPRPLPHVSADEVIARARAVASGVIGDGLFHDLGHPLGAYYFGFERALQELPPPKEIPPTATLYWAGYRDGRAAQPKLIAAGVLTSDWGSREGWRDVPVVRTFVRTVLAGDDALAKYVVDLMQIDVQPIYEPGYPAADGEIRERQPHAYYRATARLHERPLPRRMVATWQSNRSYDGAQEAWPPLPFAALGQRRENPFFQWNRYFQGMHEGITGGVMELVVSYDRPDEDAA